MQNVVHRERSKTSESTVLLPIGNYEHLQAVALKGPLTVIGSGESANLRLRSRTVSPAHAVLLNYDGQTFLRDLASHSHVYVNRRITRESFLRTNDEIDIGKIRFRLASQPIEGRKESSLSRLELRHDGKVISINKPVFLLGARQDADLVLKSTGANNGVAAAHAAIAWVDDGWYIRNLCNDHVTSVNDTRVTFARLKSGDRIAIGSRVLEARFPDDAPRPPEVENDTGRMCNHKREEQQPAAPPEPALDSCASIEVAGAEPVRMEPKAVIDQSETVKESSGDSSSRAAEPQDVTQGNSENPAQEIEREQEEAINSPTAQHAASHDDDVAHSNFASPVGSFVEESLAPHATAKLESPPAKLESPQSTESHLTRTELQPADSHDSSLTLEPNLADRIARSAAWGPLAAALLTPSHPTGIAAEAAPEQQATAGLLRRVWVSVTVLVVVIAIGAIGWIAVHLGK